MFKSDCHYVVQCAANDLGLSVHDQSGSLLFYNLSGIDGAFNLIQEYREDNCFPCGFCQVTRLGITAYGKDNMCIITIIIIIL